MTEGAVQMGDPAGTQRPAQTASKQGVQGLWSQHVPSYKHLLVTYVMMHVLLKTLELARVTGYRVLLATQLEACRSACR